MGGEMGPALSNFVVMDAIPFRESPIALGNQVMEIDSVLTASDLCCCGESCKTFL